MTADFWAGVVIGVVASWALTIAAGWLLIHALKHAHTDTTTVPLPNRDWDGALRTLTDDHA